MFEFYAINKNKVGLEQFFYLFISVLKLWILSKRSKNIHKIFKNTKLMPFLKANGIDLKHYRTLGLNPSGAFCGEFGFVIKLFDAAE